MTTLCTLLLALWEASTDRMCSDDNKDGLTLIYIDRSVIFPSGQSACLELPIDILSMK